MDLRQLIEAYRPCSEAEARDRELMLYALAHFPDVLTRENPVCHFTASNWITSPGRDKILMVYHNIYDSWSWTGGHADGETDLLAVALREAREETGLTLTSMRFRGIVTFVSDRWETEYMHLFTADDYTGRVADCEEGDLEWVPKEKVRDLPTWEGDRIFLRLLDEDAPFFSLKLVYEGERLKAAFLDGRELAL